MTYFRRSFTLHLQKEVFLPTIGTVIEHRFISNPHFSETSSPRQATASKSVWRKVLSVLLIVGMGIAVAVGVYFGWRWYSSPTAQLQRVIRRVASKIELPDSVPTVATVTDKSKLANQEFFLKAENGDQILIYPDVGKAILYRPSIDKIVEVAPIQLASNQSGLTTTNPQSTEPVNVPPPASTSAILDTSLVEPSLTATVGLYNGTNTVGLTREVESLLNEKLDLTIVFRGNALKRTYTDTIVVDTTGLQAGETQQIAEMLGAVVGELPADEATPAADIAVFIGTDLASNTE